MKQIIAIILVLLAHACRTPEETTAIPALITNPGAETRQELERTISAALNGVQITIAEDALTKNSVLVIERGLQRGINRPPELGRDMGRPYRFQLFIAGSQCILVNMENGQQWQLTTVECIEHE